MNIMAEQNENVSNEKFILPERLKFDDKIAIIAPSSGLATLFPHVYHLGLQRLKENFGLEPVEFPTAKKSGEYLATNPKARAEDINNAFADLSIKAIIATIGGEDQLKILKYLDPEVIRKNPKIFLGFSDNTNLHIYLWNMGIISYYGGNLMNQFASGGEIHQYTEKYIRKALFDQAIGEIEPSNEWTDFDLDWSDESTLTQKQLMEINPRWEWFNNEKSVTGRLWGGCLESLDFHLRANRYLPTNEQLKDCILYFETSEEMPNSDYVYRVLMGMGERGMLEQFSAILVGRPKTQFMGEIPKEGKEKYRENQRKTIKKVVQEYAPNTIVVSGLDIGHTNPQLLVPNGGFATIDGINKKIIFS